MQKKRRNKKLVSLLLCMMLTVAMAFGTTGCNGKGNEENVAQAQESESAQAQENDATAAESVKEDEQEAEDSAEESADAQTEADVQTGTETETDADAQTSEDAQADDGAQADAQELGEGETEFTFSVVDQDGNESQFVIHTDKETVGEALLELGLIAGDESEYGLYVKTVNGITADYDVDKTYWAFYVNGEYAEKGVDSTPVTAGDNYSFKVEK